MKKIGLMFLVLVTLSMPFQQNYLEVQAAVASKAATLTAKKIVKEVIQDAAVNQAANMALLEAMEIASNYEQKQGFKVVCPSGGTTCDKPVQVKTDLTDADKTKIKAQSSTELDKLISPGGKGFSRWEKLIDWFIPVWLGALAVTAITYVTDPDVKSLFDEAAYNTLVALGFITPAALMDSGEPIPPNMIQTPERTIDEGIDGDVMTKKGLGYSFTPIEFKNLVIASEFNKKSPIHSSYSETRGRDITYVIDSTSHRIGTTKYQIELPASLNQPNGVVTVALNGTVLNSVPSANTVAHPAEVVALYEKITAIRMRTPYKFGDFYYTDVLFDTVEGDIIHYEMKNQNNQMMGNLSGISAYHNIYTTAYSWPSSEYFNHRQTVFKNQSPYLSPLPIPFDEISADIDQHESSSYQDENGNIALIPPVAIPYQQESTGEEVRQVPNPTGDGWTFQKPDGTIVPEEDVVPNPDWEPQITPSPEGVPQITPQPTPENPTPEPIPLQPDPTAPPGNQTPEEPPLEPFPDGAKCDAKLQFPIFSPLKEQLSTSFPFSIPWDIERAAHAAFDGVGNEKPSFEMVIPVGDDKHYFDITTPAFLDDWKPFMDGFLLLTFDLLLMFGLYRFVKGAGS